MRKHVLGDVELLLMYYRHTALKLEDEVLHVRIKKLKLCTSGWYNLAGILVYETCYEHATEI